MNLIEIVDIVQILREHEISALEYELKERTLKHKLINDKPLTMLKYVRKGVDDDTKIAKSLGYTSKTDTAYWNTKRILYHHIKTVLMRSLEEELKHVIKDYNLKWLEMNRYGALGYYLNSRGDKKVAKTFIDKSISIAKEHEFLNEFLAYNFIHKLSFTNKRKREAKSPQIDLEQSAEFIKAQFSAVDLYFEITTPHVTKKNTELLFLERRKELLTEMEQLVTNHSVNHVHYLYYRAKVNDLMIRQEFRSALFYVQKLKVLVQKSVGLYSSRRLAQVSLLKAIILLELKMVNKAVREVLQVIEFAKPGTLLWLNMMNVLFSSYLLSNNMAEAMLISEKVSKHIKNYKPLQQAQWEYYKNLILFKKEDFEEAMKYFVKSTVLNQDSTGWHLGLKIMEIYCLFELKDGFSLDLRIGAFGKFLSRRKQSKNLFRYRAIYKVLYSLHNSNYSYNKTFNKHRKLLEDLAEARGMMYRDPLAFELICPRDWLKSKCTKEKNPK